MSSGKDLATESDDFCDRLDQRRGEAALGFALDPRLPVARLFGDTQQCFDRPRIEFPLQPWNEFVPQSISCKGVAGVGLIDEARLLVSSEAGGDDLASNAQERPPEGEACGEWTHLGDA